MRDQSIFRAATPYSSKPARSVRRLQVLGAVDDDDPDHSMDHLRQFVKDVRDSKYDYLLMQAYCVQVMHKRNEFENALKIAQDDHQRIKERIEKVITAFEIPQDRQGEFRSEQDDLKSSMKTVAVYEQLLENLKMAESRIQYWYNGNHLKDDHEEYSLKVLSTRLADAMDVLLQSPNQPQLSMTVVQTVKAFLYDPLCIRSQFLNFYIAGPPGTGKSRMAEMIAQVLALSGIFQRQEFTSKTRNDFIGQYVGQTSYLTLNSLMDGLDGVLLIDEAYRLCELDDKGKVDQYGREFAGTLVDFMTRFKGLYGIIVAGYEKEMTEQFSKGNEGIDRRFPHKFVIGEMNSETLKSIFVQHIQTAGMDTSDAASMAQALGVPLRITDRAFRLLQGVIDEARGSEGYPRIRKIFENQAASMTVLAEDVRLYMTRSLQRPYSAPKGGDLEDERTARQVPRHRHQKASGASGTGRRHDQRVRNAHHPEGTSGTCLPLREIQCRQRA